MPKPDYGHDYEDAKLRGAQQIFKVSRPWRKIYKHIIYNVPTFSNPSGRTMSLDHRERLVRIARQFDALVITDDVYDFLQWPSSVSNHTQFPTQAYLPRVVDVDRYASFTLDWPSLTSK